ncbi:SCP-like protein [Ancylostoma caninum]|uniref:SCP-like protein n=1 Tax=Ancylostoma caninum TaxID=29170 RepID=A0A368FAP9_ANCCA|nr:SCP-like protein [Ancylostoma caninum]
MHNYYRRVLATGWAKDKIIHYAKPASEMNALVYEKDLEDKAYAHVVAPARCPEASEGDTGENFWMSGDYKLSHVEAIEEAMKEWWGPLESTGLGDNLEYTADRQQGTFKYLANVAHDKTTQIGCAVKTCLAQGITVVDCRYNPAIAVDDPIYKAGKMPCKPCPTGTACSKLGGLCEATATP